METMTSAEYLTRYGSKKPRLKGDKKAQQDKAALFVDAWENHAPKDAPKPVAEFRFDTSRKFRADFKLPRKTLIEVDGGQYTPNGGRHNTDPDRFKCNLAVALGYRVMHFSPQALMTEPEMCVALVLKAIGYKPKKKAKAVKR